jgi:D-alanyl-D-alanine carboxypeptidase/D-alanyl-D-alanine-endopeptidase (penicillin-binding protein 4)
VGSPGLANFDPYNISGIALRKNIKTTTGARTNVTVNRTTTNTNDTITVSGNAGIDASIKKIYRSSGDPVQTPGLILKAFLENAGIRVTGKIRSSSVPPNTVTIYELESFPMAMHINGLNKFSNNFIADMMVKKLGSEFGSKGSSEEGMRVISTSLTNDFRVSPGHALYNGSGLDTRNRISAKQVNTLLERISRMMHIYPEFLASLPAAGWDGTLDKRFDTPSTAKLKGHVRAKTGTLTIPHTVATLAGYMNHPKHGQLAFTILQNGKAKKPQPDLDSLRRKQDEFLARVYDSTL